MSENRKLSAEEKDRREAEEAAATQMLKDRLKSVKHKLLILSGKGGVGKSTVTAHLAAILAKRGYSVGVFDCDFHGPAIPRMLGATGGKLRAFPLGIFPVEGILGIKIISMGFLLRDEKTPVIWRGPLKYSALRELIAGTIWGELDCLLFDLPPGTGDEALNVAQMIPDVDGAIVVTIPSEVSRVAVEKSAEFCKTLKIDLFGVIENMSYFICPKCGYKAEIFGSGGGERIVQEEGIPLLGKIPLDPRVTQCTDSGKPIVIMDSKAEVSKAFNEIADKVISQLGLEKKRKGKKGRKRRNREKKA